MNGPELGLKFRNRNRRMRRATALFLFFVGLLGLAIALVSMVSDDMTTAPDGRMLLLGAGSAVFVLLGAILFLVANRPHL